VNARNGVVEEAQYIEVGGGSVLSVLHRPAGAMHAGVVVAPSLFGELAHHQRHELLLARRLTASGVAAVQVQYRGTGHSFDGVDPVPTVRSMAQDLSATVAALRSQGCSHVVLLGYRLGALPVRALAQQEAELPLVLWDPVLRGDDYLRGARRAENVARSRVGDRELRPDEHELLGHPLSPWTLDSLRAASIPHEDLVARDVLIVTTDRRGSTSAEVQALVEAWEATGNRVSSSVVAAKNAWWFVAEEMEPAERRIEAQESVEVIADWVLATTARLVGA
jgi:hypothetical protein